MFKHKIKSSQGSTVEFEYDYFSMNGKENKEKKNDCQQHIDHWTQV